ncbi:glutamine synthetase family protein [Oceanibacterium hippocampi]|uniref:Gamma-glutamylputrescine synthetase PuuA n=1 Tax=Oceanibacterium hippocampi TaxID=745714 RepID=A0A1Y5RPD4_9PROT|nr:glutamine synthetase family protein [Oceanibacterium hippocampi]SLN22273.1 Gamma-glutamylputrescine synthetase PuuA [Oceanibacterium hippocampi]
MTQRPGWPDPEAGRRAAEAYLAEHPDLETVELIVVDNNGLLRGKRVGPDRLVSVMSEGMRLPGSIFALDVTGENVTGTGLIWAVGDADHPVLPADGAVRPVPWASFPTAQVLMTMIDDDGTPFHADPRQTLCRVVEHYTEMGLTPVMALELEFYLLDKERGPDGRPQPPRSPHTGRREHAIQVYSLDDLDAFAELWRDISRAARAQDVPADTVVSEYAPGQYEFNLKHVADPVAAADHAVLLKRIIVETAWRHGVEASFMAKPYVELAGSGMHLHMSVLDEQGRNVFDGTGSKADELIAPTLAHAIGGLQKGMPESMAVFVPNVNSFRRLQPGSYAPLAPTWGIDNRTVALRVPSDGGLARRVEHRVAGADANPYLATAAVLAAAHRGITEEIEPSERIAGNAYEQVPPSLPTTWPEALAAYDRGEILPEYFGREHCSVFSACKHFERHKFEAIITDLEYRWYYGCI